MGATVFYSWQSDLPSSTNRGFIKKCLERAIGNLNKELEVWDAARPETIALDHDTQGVPGIPDIFSTILQKIERADVFVADLSYVAKGIQDEPIPNPNVLIELGWALARLGSERIILVMNSSFGAPEALPFDLRHKRWPICYDLKTDSDSRDKSKIENALVDALEQAIRMAITISQQSGQGEQRILEEPVQFPPGATIVSRYISHTLVKTVAPTSQFMFLRVIPKENQEHSLEKCVELARSSRLEVMRHPRGRAGSLPTSNEWGAVTVLEYDNRYEAMSISQLLKTGEVIGIDWDMISLNRSRKYAKYGFIPTRDVEEVYTYTLSRYLEFLSKHARRPARYLVASGFVGVRDYRLAVGPEYFIDSFEGHIHTEKIVFLAEIGESAVDTKKFLNRFFDHFWAEAGVARPR